MNEIENTIIERVKDAVNTVTEKCPLIVSGEAFAFNVFNILNSPYSGMDYQMLQIIQVMQYHIHKDILEFAKSCFLEENLKKYFEPINK